MTNVAKLRMNNQITLNLRVKMLINQRVIKKQPK